MWSVRGLGGLADAMLTQWKPGGHDDDLDEMADEMTADREAASGSRSWTPVCGGLSVGK